MKNAACPVKPAKLPQPRQVRVNGVLISADAISHEMQNHPARRPLDCWKAAARALVLRELLLQEAHRSGIEADQLTDEAGRMETPDEARMRCLIESEVVTPEPRDEECRRYYDSNRRRFRTPALYHVCHILIAADRSEEARQRAQEKAHAVLQTLAQMPEGFAAMARQHSACPSRETGGNLGQIGPGQTVAEFESALETMIEGAIHPKAIETRYGFHIVRLDRRIEGRQLPYDIAKDRIAEYLADRVQHKALGQYVALLAGKASIEGVEFESAATPLVQ